MAFNPNQLMQMQAFPQRQMQQGMPPGIYQYGQPQNITQPQMQPQTMPPQAMGNPMMPPRAQGGPGQMGAFQGQMQDWRSQRPQFDPATMQRPEFRQQMQDWRQLRPQNGGIRGLAAMHVNNLDMARPQGSPRGWSVRGGGY